jgi:hypothetical protein
MNWCIRTGCTINWSQEYCIDVQYLQFWRSGLDLQNSILSQHYFGDQDWISILLDPLWHNCIAKKSWTCPRLQASTNFDHCFMHVESILLHSMWNGYSTNGGSILKDLWNEQFRRSCNSCPNTIGFQWRRDLHERQDSAQHTCDTLSGSACGSIPNKRVDRSYSRMNSANAWLILAQIP